MPEELFILATVSVVMGVYLIRSVVSMVLRHRERVVKATSTEASGSLTTSELEAMMRRAVTSALTPVQDRLDAMETRLVALPEAVRPAERRAEPRLSLEEQFEPEMPGPEVRRSVRS